MSTGIVCLNNLKKKKDELESKNYLSFALTDSLSFRTHKNRKKIKGKGKKQHSTKQQNRPPHVRSSTAAMFSEPQFVTVGDEYDKRGAHGGPRQDKPFIVPAKRRPHTEDATFSPFVSLATGEPYQSTGFEGPFRDPKGKKTGAASTRNPVPFKPGGVTHKSCGKGDYYGTFCERAPYKHETDLPPVKHPSEHTGPEPRNFTTNRPKKGGLGFTGLSIGGAGEVRYVSEPYQGSQQREALERKSAAQREMGAPFRAKVRGVATFDESEHGYSKVYSMSKPMPPKRAGPARTQPVAAKPWVPGGKLTDNITKFPDYQEDPYDLKERRVREEQQKEQQYKAWKPAGNHENDYIYTKPVEYNPPPVV
ncbi:hypothetical protein STCU_04436 [Strigomonas culicis]|uniref:Cilia-and flagella-associated protein 96 n=1 Tax=Strigomonas culicis TaxID=28005 RepID=S9W0X3_9TRYP|nr:hypothetical protein STCU_04436 [Strigomonas culicis]|eukprot:EPY29585.1 hypothetical protein STCU_04436 [Strigomonas culicis]